MKVALITGARGQDGSYLHELLQSKGYIVKCINRGEDIRECVMDCIEYSHIEIYNLAAQGHVGKSFENGTETFQTNTETILFILETVKQLGIQHKCKIFQASSSEMLGEPSSLYGISKLSAHLIAKHFRETYDMFVCSGILYNHESPRRKNTFVTQKIIQGLKSGECFTLGNIEAHRDWGHAKDYVEAMWLMLQQEQPNDYVVATGKTHSVREFIEIAVQKMGKKIVWSGKGLNGEGRIDGKIIVKVSEEFYRPDDTKSIPVANPSKLEAIGWSRKYTLPEIVEEMLFPPSEISQASNSPR
jgi:GDPmannose 4,6-dehydratase